MKSFYVQNIKETAIIIHHNKSEMSGNGKSEVENTMIYILNGCSFLWLKSLHIVWLNILLSLSSPYIFHHYHKKAMLFFPTKCWQHFSG